MKRKYIMLSMMIAGPRQPGNDIDVYLSPLIEDLRKLWEEGVDVWDGNLHKTFKMHAMVFCTINDFPAYGNLSGYSVKGHHDVAPCGACRPWIFFINGFLCFLKVNGSGIEKEERLLEMPLQGEDESRTSSPP